MKKIKKFQQMISCLLICVMIFSSLSFQAQASPISETVFRENYNETPNEMSTYKGPQINEDGSVKFFFYGDGSEETVQIKGAWDSNWGDLVSLEKNPDDENLWSCELESEKIEMTSFEYGFMVDKGETDEDGNKIIEFKTDSSNRTSPGGNSKINRNPQLNEDGSATIYYYPENNDEDIEVLYREAGTDEYIAAPMARDEVYIDIYSVRLKPVTGTYEYKLSINGIETEDINTSQAEFYIDDLPEPNPDIKSPVIEGTNVTFNYYGPTAKVVQVAGNFTSWGTNPELLAYNADTGYWSLTRAFEIGNYEYKLVVDGDWINDPLNSNASNGNNIFVIEDPDLEEDGLKSPIIDSENGTVTFNYKPSSSFVEGTKVDLMGTLTDWDNGLSMIQDEEGIFTVTIELEPGAYEYKFRVGANWISDPLNKNLSLDNNSQVIMPGMEIIGSNPAGSGTHSYIAKLTSSIDGSVSDATKNVTWSIEEDVPGVVISEGGILTIGDDVPSGYITVVVDYMDNEVAKSQTRKLYYTQKALIFQYEGENLQDSGDVYIWYNSIAENVGYGFKEVNGIRTSYVTIGEGKDIEPGFIVRLYGAWGSDDREFDDRTAKVHNDDLYTKVKLKQGSRKVEVLPSGKTYFDQGIIFNYRDDKLFYENRMDEIESVNVVINGVSNPMTYSSNDELFTYNFQEIDEGEYEYYFDVKLRSSDEISKENDQYNPITSEEGYSLLTYEKVDLEIKASTNPSTVNYNQNAVLSLELNSDIELKEVYADLSALGAGSKVLLNKESLEGTIYISEEVTAGVKTIPITVIDSYGNIHRARANITVATNTSKDIDWDEARIYFLLLDRFSNGDQSNDGESNVNAAEAYHGGDFKGLTSKLDYIEKMGINTLWITPIVDNIDHIVNVEHSQYGYHGYWAKDFTTIDEHLGTLEDFKTLIDEAHDRGIKIMVDVVLNHGGYGTEEDGEYPVEAFEGMYRTDPGTDVITGELAGLPDFITEDKEVRAKLIEWQTAWAELTTDKGNRIDYFRVDTVKHVEHELWQDFKVALTKANPNFKMIGEYFGASIDSHGDYLGNGEMDSLLDFEFKSIARDFVDGNIEKTELRLNERNNKLSNYLTMGQFLSSHDEDGFLYSLGGDLAKMKVAAALQITAKGQPVIYYGEEINLTGPNTFGLLENNRYDMEFDDLDEEQEAMLEHYTKLLTIRGDYSKIFSKGSRNNLVSSNTEGYSVFSRSYKGEDIIVGLNTKDQEAKVTFDVPLSKGSILSDLYNNKEYVVTRDGEITIDIPSSTNGGTAILAVKSKASKPSPLPKPTPPLVDNTREETLQIDIGHVNGSTLGKVNVSIKTTVKGDRADVGIDFSTEQILEIIDGFEEGDKINVSIRIPESHIKELLENKNIKDIFIELKILDQVLDNDMIETKEIILAKEILRSMKEQGKDITFAATSDEGELKYEWKFRHTYLNKSDKELADVNLLVNLQNTKGNKDIHKLLKKNAKSKTGVLLSFDGKGSLPATVELKAPVSKLGDIKSGGRAYVYRFNKEKNTLETLVGGSSYRVDKDGFINLNLVTADDYVIMSEKISNNIMKTLRQQITAPSKMTLKKGKAKNIKIVLPETLVQVNKLSDQTQSKAIGQVTITYESSNKKVALVDKKTGNVKGKKAGKATITAKVKLYSGKVKQIKIKVTVK